jgi:hypothetical protein
MIFDWELLAYYICSDQSCVHQYITFYINELFALRWEGVENSEKVNVEDLISPM